MAKSVRANVKPDILVWARETAGYNDIEVAGKRLQVKPERLAAWEEGTAAPTINQLRKMASVYGRPLSVFYLQERPTGFQVLRDFRRLPGGSIREYSPALVREMRLAQQRRELALELYSELEEEPPAFTLSTTLAADPETVAAKVREALGITHAVQSKWREARVAFNAWRAAIEALGVLVFQMDRVSPEEVSGFAVSAKTLPVIAVTRKNTPFTRRTFSLLHELVHLMLRESGVSDIDADVARAPELQAVEVFCNQVAAAALMPRERFLTQELVHARPGRMEWAEPDIVELSTVFSVSREAVVRRLLSFGRVSEDFYRRKRSQYHAEDAARRAREKEKYQDQEFRKNPPRDALSNFGKPFVRLILNNYYQDRITLSDVSSYLGLRVRHVPTIERTMGLG